MRSIDWTRSHAHAGVQLVFSKERVPTVADWSFTSPHHDLIVHLGGRLNALETAFESGLAASTLPETGDIWAAPGGERYSAYARSGGVSYCEIRLTAARHAEREMAARIAHHDEFLHALARRGASTAGVDDGLSAMLLSSIAEAAERHIELTYFKGAPAPARSAPGLGGAAVRALKAHIDENPEADHSLRAMSSIAGAPERGFIEAFRLAFGVTPHQYVIDRRIETAKRLLRRETLPLTEVAMRTGFSTPSHFSTTFRKRVGVTPRAYRNGI
jgi:AraC family transcriptional regulator